MSEPIQVHYFSDVLCVWAYVSQIRVDQLRESYPEDVRVDCRYFQVFGNIGGWLDSRWSDRGGVAAYAAHVKEVSGRFDHATVGSEVWTGNTPTSSMPSHLFLCAVRLWATEHDEHSADDTLQRVAWAVRTAFFQDGVDVSQRSSLLTIAEGIGLPVSEIGRYLEDGRAHAALSEDLDLARQYDVRSSPTLLFNEGRQRLAGNVGYRIIEANVRELLESPTDRQSWC